MIELKNAYARAKEYDELEAKLKSLGSYKLLVRIVKAMDSLISKHEEIIEEIRFRRNELLSRDEEEVVESLDLYDSYSDILKRDRNGG